MPDVIKIEMDEHPGTWNRVFVNDKLQISTDNREHVIKFVTQLIRYDVGIVPFRYEGLEQ